MKALTAFLLGLTASLFVVLGRKPAHRTEPKRPGLMYRYPDTEERAWRKWSNNGR